MERKYMFCRSVDNSCICCVGVTFPMLLQAMTRQTTRSTTLSIHMRG